MFSFKITSYEMMSFAASLIQSLVSHDPSEIIWICWFHSQETILLIINVESSSA